MFAKIISQSPLVGGVPETFFNRITGGSFDGDVSFLATLRALVHPRLGENENVRLRFTRSSYSEDVFKANTPSRVMGVLYNPADYDDGAVVVHNVYGKDEDVNGVFDGIDENFTKKYSDWVRLEKVTEFFHKSFRTSCFINAECKKVIVFVENLNVRRLHCLQIAIFAFMPWYFDPEKGVTTEEMELIQSLRERSADKYEECIEKIASKYDFRTLGIRSLLKGFETKYERAEAENVRREIENIYSSISDYDRYIRDLLKSKRDYEIKLLGLEAKIASTEESGDSEIMEYFLCNSKLSLDDVTDDTLTFSCCDYLTYFDEDMAASMISNRRSYVYIIDGRRYNNYIKEEDIERLMKAIFVEQKLRMKFCAAYRFNLGYGVTALTGYNYGTMFKDCMPNPHTDRYSCMGNYQREITARIKENDYIGAIEQSIASCKSLNFGDSTVMQEFMRRVYGINEYTKNRCIELPDGSVVTPKEAVAWLNEQEKQEAEGKDE